MGVKKSTVATSARSGDSRKTAASSLVAVPAQAAPGDALELPYRVIDVPAGDLGLSAIRKFDCEAWIPSQQRYREVSSASNCTQFQARRLDIRTRAGSAESAGGTTAVATLNGTLCAMTRTIIALLENGQQADGSVRLPAILHPFLGEVLEPAT